MKDIRFPFRKNRALFAIGLIVCIGAGLVGCAMLLASAWFVYLFYDMFEDSLLALIDILLPLVPGLPSLALSVVAGGILATRHRRAYVTITEEGLTVRNVVLWGSVTHHRFTIKSGMIAGNVLTLSIWDRSIPKEQRINLDLMNTGDADSLLNWLAGQGVPVQRCQAGG